MPDETPTTPTTGSTPQDSPENAATPEPSAEATAAADDVKARFRAALEAKQSAQHRDLGGGGGRTRLEGHGKDGSHGHRVFRRKSG